MHRARDLARGQPRFAYTADLGASGRASAGEPMRFECAWEDRPGGATASILRSQLRSATTQSTYDTFVSMWLGFNDLGHHGRPYDPLVATVDKFMLFAGWLAGDLGERRRSTNQDLNMFRSAINRWLDDNQAGRPLKGSIDLNKLIARYRELQVASKIDAGLHLGN